MRDTYRTTWQSLRARLSWPSPGDSRYEERTAACWEDMRMCLLEQIYRWMADADAFAVDLETILRFRAGNEWWREEKIDEVEKLLDSLGVIIG